MIPEYLKIQLERSGDAGLTVRLSHSRHPECRCLAWNLLKSHSYRWKRLRLRLQRPGLCRDHNCIETLGELYLPILTDLCMDTEMHKNGKNCIGDFKWSMPKLETLYSKSHFDLDLSLTTPLINLVVISEDYGRQTLRPLALLNFLTASPLTQLETLRLDFAKYGGFYIYDDYPDIDMSAVRVCLPHLKTLVADFGHYDNYRSGFAFLTQINTPSLSHLDLRMFIDHALYRDFAWDWIAKVATTSSLVKVNIAFTDPYVEFPEDVLREKISSCFKDSSSAVAGKYDGSRYKKAIEIGIKFEKQRSYCIKVY